MGLSWIRQVKRAVSETAARSAKIECQKADSANEGKKKDLALPVYARHCCSALNWHISEARRSVLEPGH